MAIAKKSKNASAERRAEATIIEALGGRIFAEDELIFEGDKFIIPELLDLDSAISFLSRKKIELEEIVSFSRTYNYRPWDGAASTERVFRRVFGSVSISGMPGFFGPTPPEFIDVPIGPHGEKVSVPWGVIGVPYLKGVEIFLGATANEYGTVFNVHVNAPKKYRKNVERLLDLIEEELIENSIYRGKAFDGAEMPEFIDPYVVDRNRIVYSEETQRQIEANIFAGIRYPEQMERLGVSSKRAIMLAGDYGTGKTSLAMIVAQEALENGWTFVYARPHQDLQSIFQTARMYEGSGGAGSVIFFEDLDKMQGEYSDRNSLAELLDIFDGVGSKNARILAILTTNYPEKIQPGMLRPGRLDHVLEIGALDAPGIQRLIELAVPESMRGEDIDWEAVAAANVGDPNHPEESVYLPAFIREAADRAKRSAIFDSEGNEDAVQLTTESLVTSAVGLRAQWRMMMDAPELRSAPDLEARLRTIVSEQTEAEMTRFAEELFGNEYPATERR